MYPIYIELTRAQLKCIQYTTGQTHTIAANLKNLRTLSLSLALASKTIHIEVIQTMQANLPLSNKCLAQLYSFSFSLFKKIAIQSLK